MEARRLPLLPLTIPPQCDRVPAMNTDATKTVPAMPRLEAGPAGAGQREAIRAFYEHYFTLDTDAMAVVDRVVKGSAPLEFKRAFCTTFTNLCEAVER